MNLDLSVDEMDAQLEEPSEEEFFAGSDLSVDEMDAQLEEPSEEEFLADLEEMSVEDVVLEEASETEPLLDGRSKIPGVGPRRKQWRSNIARTHHT